MQTWNAVNRRYAKYLMPFLPTLLEVMERHHHLSLSPECRAQLLTRSTATADCLLRPHRQHAMHGLCTTRAGTLLKSSIPLRTFEQWDEQVPGFVEADLVAHCGSSVEGTYLFTLTLTDIATNWTECQRNGVYSSCLRRARTARRGERASRSCSHMLLGCGDC